MDDQTRRGDALRVAVLVKQIPKVQELELGPDGRLQRDGVPLEMNAYCRRAVSKGVELARATGGTCTVLTLGPPPAEQVLREAMAWGADDAVLVTDPAFAGSDTLVTARALARALEICGPFDLVLTGRNSLDADTGQVGPAVAELAGLPFLAAVRELSYDAPMLRVRCEEDDGWLVAEVDLPAALSCAERLCEPAKAPAETWPAAAGRVRRLSAADLGRGPWGSAGSPTTVGEVRLLASQRRPLVLTGPMSEQVVAAVRLCSDPGAPPPTATAAPPAPATSVPTGRVVVVVAEPDRPRIAQELLGAAGRLADTVVAVTFDVTSAGAAGSWGADVVVPVRGTTLPDAVAPALADWLQREQPWAVLAPGTLWGRELSARVAARLAAGLVGDAVDLDAVGERLVAWKPACAGRLLAAIRSRSAIQLVTVRPGVLREPGRPRAGRTSEPLLAAERSGLRVVERGRDDDLEELGRAVAVVAVGSGVDPADYPLLTPLTDALGAELAATRKVTDAGWLPHSRQVGITGRSIAPSLYVAIGISGKPNHLLGVRGARTVLAVNSDATAPIFAAADIGIVGDWREVVPLLAAEFARTGAAAEALTTQPDDGVDLDARTAG